MYRVVVKIPGVDVYVPVKVNDKVLMDADLGNALNYARAWRDMVIPHSVLYVRDQFFNLYPIC